MYDMYMYDESSKSVSWSATSYPGLGSL